MTNTRESQRTFVNALDCINAMLDEGFYPFNNDGVTSSSNGIYRHFQFPVVCRVVDVETGEFDFSLYKIIEVGDRNQLGPRLCFMSLKNVDLKYFVKLMMTWLDAGAAELIASAKL